MSNNIRATRRNSAKVAAPSRGQSSKRLKAKRVTPKRVQLMTSLVALTSCIFAIPLAISYQREHEIIIDGLPNLRIAGYDFIAYILLSLIVQVVYHTLGSTREQKIAIQFGITKTFLIIALLIYAAFRAILYFVV